MITLLIILDAALIGFQVEVDAKKHYDAFQAARIIDQVNTGEDMRGGEGS
jgi:hypothetical protein